MMEELARVLADADLRYLVRIAAPEARDPAALAHALREDADILAGMLRDPRLLRHLMAESERVVTISPRLFFAALLTRIRSELERGTYTVERDERHTMLVFDSREVAGLLHRGGVLPYLVEMLGSFVRMRSRSCTIRLRRGTWRRLVSSDMDIDSLIAEGEHVGEGGLFGLERRIADVCLLQLGFYPGARAGRERDGVRSGTARERIAEVGRRYYHLASGRREAREQAVAETLEELAEHFAMAAKPLTLLARGYLDHLGEPLFAP
jgi:hypothetical protein